ncbi:MAG: hypothetical protein P0111_17670 [Nitrospira sp.]|nr:hypothetical protein [Nitrospira sp.]
MWTVITAPFVSTRWVIVACLVVTVAGMSACAALTGERTTYNQGGAKVGLERDPSIARAKTEVHNAHPANLAAAEVRTLLGAVEVSGWTGTIVGIFENPRPVPLLPDEQLDAYSGPLSDALRQAGAAERVTFSFPKPGVKYSDNRTIGSLFVRDKYLHVVLTDHASLTRADTGGDDLKDPRDTKGMKLWVASPARAAVVPDAEEPKWAPFETVHVSLDMKEAIALRSAKPPVQIGRESAMPTPAGGDGGPSRQDLQNQVRELTNSNLELRGRLDDQANQMKALTEEMNRLRLEMDQAKPSKAPPRKSSTP